MPDGDMVLTDIASASRTPSESAGGRVEARMPPESNLAQQDAPEEQTPNPFLRTKWAGKNAAPLTPERDFTEDIKLDSQTASNFISGLAGMVVLVG